MVTGRDSTQGFWKARPPLFFLQALTSPKKKQIPFIKNPVTDPRADNFTVEVLHGLCHIQPPGGLVKHVQLRLRPNLSLLRGGTFMGLDLWEVRAVCS